MIDDGDDAVPVALDVVPVSPQVACRHPVISNNRVSLDNIPNMFTLVVWKNTTGAWELKLPHRKGNVIGNRDTLRAKINK